MVKQRKLAQTRESSDALTGDRTGIDDEFSTGNNF